MTLADAALHHNLKWGSRLSADMLTSVEFGVAVDAGRVMGHVLHGHPAFYGRRDREIAHALPPTLGDFWFGHL